MTNVVKLVSSSSIGSQIRSRILLSGPIPVADYMRLALTKTPVSQGSTTNGKNDSGGYYMKNDVFGRNGDFITSPEITQMFGELLGVWGIECWKLFRGPSEFNLVELGPGRGTLSRDMLRVFEKFGNVIGKDVSLNMVEVSPHLSKLQRDLLCGPENAAMHEKATETHHIPENSYLHGHTCQSNFPVTWYKDIRDVPKQFSFYVAHEFLDALPIHKLQKVNDDWREVLIDVNPENESEFRFILSRHETPVVKVLKSGYPKVLETTRNHLEISLDALVVLDEITSRLDEYGGMAVIVDYGHDGTKDDTFRAFRRHKLHDPLIAPGSADLTADVDFSMIKQIFSENALICGPVSQQTFLGRLGIDVRLETLLASTKTETEKEQLESGYKMIMNDMGTRFHFLGLFPKVLEQFLPRMKIAGFH